MAAGPRLAAPAVRVLEALDGLNPRLALKNARFRHGAPDGLPIPPADLRFLVAGTKDVSWFLEGGRLAAQAISEAVGRAGSQVDDLDAILDFGCGCGRVLRHWNGLQHAAVFGCDYNPSLTAWCAQKLPFAQVGSNDLTPPLRYADGQFDLVYALSVFTHLTAGLQTPWFAELARVIKPRGLLIISTHGEAYAARLNSEERRRFAAGELVVKNNITAPGTNACAAYHPERYVRDRLASNLELLEFLPEGASGNPRQDLYVFRAHR